MDTITMETLKNFLGRSQEWLVSIYMPAHRKGRETEQDPIRYKNLLRDAEERLLAKGLRTPDVEEMLAPARELLNNPDFWQHQSDGLAVFISRENLAYFRLPLPFEELVVISDRFHIKPLLPYLANDGHFFILALSQNEVRLIEGTHHTVDEVDLENIPNSLAEAMRYEQFEKNVQFHTRTADRPGKRAAAFHGHGGVSEDEKNRLLRWFHKIDDDLPGILGSERSPLVLAGVEYLLPIYTEANSYPHLLEEGITGNPEEMTAEELHAQAWKLVEPVFETGHNNALEQFNQLQGSDQATNDVKDAVLAAHYGRVDSLFVAVDDQVWGSFDPDAATVEIHEHHQPGDEDLLDLAAIRTILNGGTVYAVAPDQVPGGDHLAAVLRY